MRRYDHIHELIGDTPVVRLYRIVPAGSATVWAKLESENPARSVKDRIARSMVEAAEKRGELRPGMTIVEATGGSTGIGLAMIAASKGYKAVIVMPESMTAERRAILKAYGAQVVLTPTGEDMPGAVKRAREIAEQLGSAAWHARQFENPDNPAAHRFGTGPEILKQVPEIDVFVAGAGTGGTMTGTAEVLRAAKPGVRIVAVESADSPVLTTGKAGLNRIQGISVGFVPKILNRGVYDEAVAVTYEDAMTAARQLGRKEGILAGISAGAALVVALREAASAGPGKCVVFIIPDYGERYLSHELWANADSPQ